MAADAAIVIASLCMASSHHRAGRNGKLATKRRPRFPRVICGRRRNLCRNGIWRTLQRDDITASSGGVNDLTGRLFGKALLGALIDDYSAEVRPKQKAA
jgi:hypothetical protein